MIIILLLILVVLLTWTNPTWSGSSESGQLTQEDYDDVKFIQDNFDNKTFDPIYRADQLYQAKYRRSNLISLGCHAGQRKLLLTEIQFYKNLPEDSIIIYSGSAPGEHTSVIMKLFPKFKFILIDPAYHAIDEPYISVYQNPDVIDKNRLRTFEKMLDSKDKKIVSHVKRLTDPPTLYGDRVNLLKPELTKTNWIKLLAKSIKDDDTRIYIIQDYLSPALVDQLKQVNLKRFSYVSDIRSNMVSDTPTDLDYIWNDALQLYLIKTLRPEFSMLKFHPPYYDDNSIETALNSDNPNWKMVLNDINKVKEFGLDMIETYKKGQHLYLDNIQIYLQAWAPVHSSETRLIIDQASIDKPYRNYDHSDWDNKFFYLRRLRTYGYFDKFYKIVKDDPRNQYDGCFDCMLEMFILGKYLTNNKQWSMDSDQIADTIKQNLDKFFDLSTTVNGGFLYPSIRSVKCGIHDQLILPPRGLNVFFSLNKQLYKFNVKTNRLRQIRSNQRNELNIADNTKASQLATHTIERFRNRSNFSKIET